MNTGKENVDRNVGRSLSKKKILKERNVSDDEADFNINELGDDDFDIDETKQVKTKNKRIIKEISDIKEEIETNDLIIKKEANVDESLVKRSKPNALKRKYKSDSEDEDFIESSSDPKKLKTELTDSEDDFKPEKKPKTEDNYSEDEFKPEKKKIKKKSPQKKSGKPKKKTLNSDEPTDEKSNKKKVEMSDEPTEKKQTKKEIQAEEEEKMVWKWWEEEEKLPEGIKWKFLEHKGPVFAPLYARLPKHVRFLYNGKTVELSEHTEECATFYGKMLDHDYTTNQVFNMNYFRDWRKVMTPEEKGLIRDLSKCDFSEINEHFKTVSEQRKARSKEEKKAEKESNEELIKDYGVCDMDGHPEKIGNFRTEPPSLFRGRGEHPKQGMIKHRIEAEDVIINCSEDSKIPEPPAGHKWKEVKHDNTVSWLASWTENIQSQTKYVMLNQASRLKGEKDWEKYEVARRLKGCIVGIRENYEKDLKDREMRIRQRAVALYLIDKFALRAGNEKDEEEADTVGCCSLRYEHVELLEKKEDKEWVLVFDFLGKDSIRYYQEHEVEKRVWKNIKLFKENKKSGDDLFDRLDTSMLNEYLRTLMPGLSAKVFRTYNASITLQEQLVKLTDEKDNAVRKMLSYNQANRAVAVLCNHQRAVPKTHEKSMENLGTKIEAKHEVILEGEKEFKIAKKAYKKSGKAPAEKIQYEKKKKALERLLDQLEKLEIMKTDKDENKTISLGTSKLNYLDPRISVAWCKKHEVPVEKVYSKTHRQKFRYVQ